MSTGLSLIDLVIRGKLFLLANVFFSPPAVNAYRSNSFKISFKEGPPQKRPPFCFTKLGKCYPLNISHWKIHISHSRLVSVWNFSETYDIDYVHDFSPITHRELELIPCRCGEYLEVVLIWQHKLNPLTVYALDFPMPYLAQLYTHTHTHRATQLTL